LADVRGEVRVLRFAEDIPLPCPPFPSSRSIDPSVSSHGVSATRSSGIREEIERRDREKRSREEIERREKREEIERREKRSREERREKREEERMKERLTFVERFRI